MTANLYERVAAIRARHAAAAASAPGEWELDTNEPFSDDLVGIFLPSQRRYAIQFHPDHLPTSRVAEFVAHARDDVELLLEHCETLASARVSLLAKLDARPHDQWCDTRREGAPGKCDCWKADVEGSL